MKGFNLLQPKWKRRLISVDYAEILFDNVIRRDRATLFSFFPSRFDVPPFHCQSGYLPLFCHIISLPAREKRTHDNCSLNFKHLLCQRTLSLLLSMTIILCITMKSWLIHFYWSVFYAYLFWAHKYQQNNNENDYYQSALKFKKHKRNKQQKNSHGPEAIHLRLIPCALFWICVSCFRLVVAQF